MLHNAFQTCMAARIVPLKQSRPSLCPATFKAQAMPLLWTAVYPTNLHPFLVIKAGACTVPS